AVGCCRRVTRFVTDPLAEHGLAAAERLADGQLPSNELRSVRTALRKALDRGRGRINALLAGFERRARTMQEAQARYDNLRQARDLELQLAPRYLAVNALGPAYSCHIGAVSRSRYLAFDGGRLVETGAHRHLEPGGRTELCLLLRDVMGLLPSRPVSGSPGWLRWRGGTILKLAQGIYEERAFDRLPVLADALEDAGCTDPDLLDHCRGPGPHVPGCWV